MLLIVKYGYLMVLILIDANLNDSIVNFIIHEEILLEMEELETPPGGWEVSSAGLGSQLV